MRRKFWELFLLVAATTGFMAVPLGAAADTLSVTQVITIRAVVLPARSIVVNDKHQMIMIYSNTNQNVTPKVYLNKAPGPELALTPALQTQYESIIGHAKNLDGVAIPVTPPGSGASLSSLQHTLFKAVSTVLRPL